MSELKSYEVDYSVYGTMRIKAVDAADAEKAVLDELEYQTGETNLTDLEFYIEETKEIV